MSSAPIDIPGYQILRELGAGGMATVYLALQTSLDRQVAIKVMRRAGADESFEKRFLLEGRTMAKLPHRNIVGVYDIVQNEAINYIAMEYLGGGTLADRLREGLSLAEAVAIVVQIAGALQFAHDSGVIHRDLKPANIMFRDRFTPVLTDFGIARQQDSEATRLTQTGMMIGTPTYMSPEQATGSDLDGRSDQYSLGVLFYEMLTGSVPFQGETPLNVVLAHLNNPPPPLPAQFAHFQPVMDRLLAKSADQRYPDLTAFVRELKSLLTHSDTLMAQLRIDPNQSASEQLRALGFSESQINTGQGSSPSALADAMAANRRGDTTRQSGPGVRMDPTTRHRRRRPPWLVPAAAAAALVVAVLLGWLLLGRDQLDPALRAVVNEALGNADRLIAEGKLVGPPGENAFEKIQTVLQVAPGLDEAEQRLDAIVAQLAAAAERAVGAGELELAETRVGEALAVRPGDASLAALQQRIETARLAAQRQQRIRDLLTRAEQAEREGRALGEGNDTALALLRQAQQIEPGNAEVSRRLAALVDGALAPAREALAAGDLRAAEGRLVAAAGWFAAEPAWQQLRSEIDAAAKAAERERRLAELLAEARRQRDAGRLAEPAGDNALETLVRAAEVDPDSQVVARLRAEVGKQLADRAAAAERGGDLGAALSLYQQALQAVPDESLYLASRHALQQRLGERETRIAALLADARSAIGERRYLAPAGNNARESLAAVLEIDPDQPDARRLAAELPRLIREAADALADEGRPGEAVALLERASEAYPRERALAERAAQLTTARDREQAQARRNEDLAALREELAKRQLNVASARAVGDTLRRLLDADPRDAEALGYRDTYLQGVGRVVASAQDAQTLDTLAPIVAQIERSLGGGPDVAELGEALATRREALAEAERERIAASQGILVLNGLPWAEVVSVVDQANGREQLLPRERSTPLRLALPAGTYRVSFRHPAVREPVVLVATLAPRQQAALNATFPTLGAERFLRDAGWSP